MTYQLNKIDAWIVKDWLNSRFRELIKEYIEEQKQSLTAGITSPVSEDMSKTIYNKRDMELKEYSDLEEFLKIPQFLLTRISNQTDISVEDDH